MTLSRMIKSTSIALVAGALLVACEVKQSGGDKDKPKRVKGPVRITSDGKGNVTIKPFKGKKAECDARAAKMAGMNQYAQKLYETAFSNGMKGIPNNNSSGSLRKELGDFLMTYSGLDCDGQETTDSFQANISRYIEQLEQIP